MLTRLRGYSRRFLEAPARLIIRLGMPADAVTLLGLAAALPSLYTAYAGMPLLTLVLIALSGFLDALDGSVARLSGTVSRAGAFLDSTTDRLADMLYYLSLMLLGLSPLLASTAMGLALVTSYTRARSAALGLRDEEGMGLMERGDRILFILAVIAVYMWRPAYADYMLALLALLSLYTVVERSAYYYRWLRSPASNT
jgi:archaetidylinositol phosphate synthase